MSTDEGAEHREVEHREGSKTEMGKARLSGDEVALIDRVRGDIGRGVWLRDIALRFAATSPLPVLDWPSSIPPDGDRTIDVGFRLTADEAASINKVRGGIPLGTWIRETAVRVAGASETPATASTVAPLLWDLPATDSAVRASKKMKLQRKEQRRVTRAAKKTGDEVSAKAPVIIRRRRKTEPTPLGADAPMVPGSGESR